MIARTDRSPQEPDRDLERRVSGYLAERGVPALRRVAVKAHRGEVTFKGKVGSFYEKQLLLNSFHAVPGVVAIVDCVDVA